MGRGWGRGSLRLGRLRSQSQFGSVLGYPFTACLTVSGIYANHDNDRLKITGSSLNSSRIFGGGGNDRLASFV